MTVLVIGEALVDVIVRPGQPARTHPGGSPLNVAVGLGRLGLPVALLSRFGTDSHGDLIAAHLGHHRVDVLPGSIGPHPTSVAEATIGADGAATYRFHVDWALNPHDIPGTAPTAVHTGSIAATLEPGAAAVTAALHRLRHTATITYDPNIRPDLTPDRESTARRVSDTIAVADVVKASDEDIAWLHPGVDPATVARKWLALGPALILVTHGSSGARAYCRAGTVTAPARRVRVTDTVGAGDAFMSGLLAALADRGLLGRANATHLHDITLDTAREVTDFATHCAAVTVTRPGANPPTRQDLANS